MSDEEDHTAGAGESPNLRDDIRDLRERLERTARVRSRAGSGSGERPLRRTVDGAAAPVTEAGSPVDEGDGDDEDLRVLGHGPLGLGGTRVLGRGRGVGRGRPLPYARGLGSPSVGLTPTGRAAAVRRILERHGVRLSPPRGAGVGAGDGPARRVRMVSPDQFADGGGGGAMRSRKLIRRGPTSVQIPTRTVPAISPGQVMGEITPRGKPEKPDRKFVPGNGDIWNTRGDALSGVELMWEFKKLRMTFPVVCRYPACAKVTKVTMDDLWTNNYVVPGKILRRLGCRNCGLLYLVFGWGGDLEDSCTIQVQVQDDVVEDPHHLGFPAGFHSWRHLYWLLDCFLEQNRAWTREVSFDDWATCRSVQLRVIAVNPLPVWSRTARECVVSEQFPKLRVKGPAPTPSWPTLGSYSQSYCNETGSYLDHPRREGVLYHGLGTAVKWVDVGFDLFDDDSYLITGGLHQNQVPRKCEEFLPVYEEDVSLDRTPCYLFCSDTSSSSGAGASGYSPALSEGPESQSGEITHSGRLVFETFPVVSFDFLLFQYPDGCSQQHYGVDLFDLHRPCL